MTQEELYQALDQAWEEDNYRDLIEIYSALIDDWEPDQPLHYSGLATVYLLQGNLDQAQAVLEHLDAQIPLNTKEAQKDRDLAWGYLYAARGTASFQGVDSVDGIEYRYPLTDPEVDQAEEWLKKARSVPARDAYLKEQIQTLTTITQAYRKENKKKVFVGSRPVAFGGFLLAILLLFRALYNAPTPIARQLRTFLLTSTPQAVLDEITRLITAPGDGAAAVAAYLQGFTQAGIHPLQHFWAPLLYLASAILYTAVCRMPRSKAQKALSAKAAHGRRRWSEFQQALNTKNTNYQVTTTTHYSDGSTRRETSTRSDNAQGNAIMSSGCGHFLTYIFRVILIPAAALYHLIRWRLLPSKNN